MLTGLPLKAVKQRDRQEDRLRRRRGSVSLSLERRLSDRIAPELRRQVFDALAESPRNVVSLAIALPNPS